jgi:deazaflavin-dependent oxidoreductase (nitroreductase family)
MNPIAKAAFKTATKVNVALYRATKGKFGGGIKGMPVLLLTVPGRKTGKPHTNPVVFLKSGDSWVVTGSAGGMPAEPQWFRNLRAADRAVVEVGADRTTVSVAIANAEQHEQLWAELVAKAPYFADYQKKCERVIPMALLTPQ